MAWRTTGHDPRGSCWSRDKRHDDRRPCSTRSRRGKKREIHQESVIGPEELSSGGSDPKRMMTACLRVSSVNALQKPSTRSEDIIVESREVHINRLLDTGAVKDWNREDAIKTGAQILSVRFVDDAHKEKSRWCAIEFVTYKDQSVFAAASDVANTSLIDLLAVKRGHGFMCFDAVAAFGQALETELIFIEAFEEHKVGQHVLWQCLTVMEGRRKQARAWQDHIVDTLLSKECPTIIYSSEFEIALDLHVDDGFMTGPAERMMEVFAYLEGNIVLIIGVGNSFEHVGALRVIDEKGMWVKELDKYESSVLTMMQMKDCRP